MLRLSALFLFAAVSLPAQGQTSPSGTPQAPCQVWTTGLINGPPDSAYRRCALDKYPVPRPGQEMPPSPRFYAGAGSTLQIMVNADGSVHSSQSRSLSRSQDVEFNEQALATIKRWRFEPAERAGVPVRSIFYLEIGTGERPSDTLPARLEWRYASARAYDTLRGQWVNEPTPAPFAPEQVDSVHVATLRQLTMMGVVRTTKARGYCLAAVDTGAAVRARLVRVARAVKRDIPDLTTGECKDTPERVRLLLPRVHHTENGRAVLYVAGAQLPRWPFAFDAREWPHWKGRCIAAVRERETVPISCDVAPDAPWRELAVWDSPSGRPRPAARAPESEHEAMNVAVLATMSGAYGIDTLRARVRTVPRFRDFAQRDSAPRRESWILTSPDARDTNAFVVHADPATKGLQVTRVYWGRRDPGPVRRALDSARQEQPDRFAAFLLEGVGTRPREPVSLCFGPGCTFRYVLEARRNTLKPLVRFRVSALRDVSKTTRGQLQLRVVMDPVPEGLMPILVIAGPATPQPHAFFLRDLGGGIWDWNWTFSPDWTKQEALVFLVRK